VATGTSDSDNKVDRGQSYTYWVSVVDRAGNQGPESNHLTVTPADMGELRRTHCAEAGFTITELRVTSMILLVIVTVAMTLLIAGQRATSLSTRRGQTQDDVRLAVDRLTDTHQRTCTGTLGLATTRRRSYFTDGQSYTASSTELEAIEPSLKYNRALKRGRIGWRSMGARVELVLACMVAGGTVLLHQMLLFVPSPLPWAYTRRRYRGGGRRPDGWRPSFPLVAVVGVDPTLLTMGAYHTGSPAAAHDGGVIVTRRAVEELLRGHDPHTVLLRPDLRRGVLVANGAVDREPDPGTTTRTRRRPCQGGRSDRPSIQATPVYRPLAPA
jgi:hypothetical protein